LYPPIIREITDGQRQFGFIWYCVNNARNTIKNESVRGILIKAKGGFSIADRKYLEPYFGRPVISRRITGELIVNNDDLVPNAARSDFENNSTRQAFLEVMPKTIREIDKVVNNIQEKEKARETLKNIYSFLLNDINNKLVAYQRDYDRLLKFNSTIDSIREWLVEHKTTLEEIEPDAIKITCDLLEGCQNFISEALNSEKKTREKLENQIVETVQRESEQSPTSQTDQTISSLHDVVEELGITEPNNYNRFIDYLDSLIKELLETNDYLELLLELRSHLEENP